MANEIGGKTELPYPVPKFYFEVELPGAGTIGVQSVEGLSAEVNLTEYRHSNSPGFYKIKMPGMKVYQNVTIKKGVFKNDRHFFDWYNQIKLNTIARGVVMIRLLDENGEPVMQWTLNAAFPIKITPPDLNSQDDGDPAIEEIEIAYESMMLS